MIQNSEPTRPENPAEIARGAFHLLVKRRIIPTPDAYRLAYDEVAGVARRSDAETVLADFAASVTQSHGPFAQIGNQIAGAIGARDWDACGKHLGLLLARQAATPDVTAPAPDAIAKPQAPPKTFLASAAAALSLPNLSTRGGARSSATAAERHEALLRDMLSRTLSLALTSLLRGAAELAEEADQLGSELKTAHGDAALEESAARLRQLCFKIEVRSGDMAEQQELLLRLFRLLLDNIGEFIEDDAWMRGQVATVHALLSAPINHRALDDAARGLKEVIYRQGVLKQGMVDAKSTVKKMMLTFIDHLGSIAATTGDFHEKIDNYAQQVSQETDIGMLNEVLEKIMNDTRATQIEALRSRDGMLDAQRHVHDAEARIQELEAQFAQLSELVREDQLTGSLNRRGLDDMLEREIARAERRGLPLCVTMLDLDNFKIFNDTHGHLTGDEVLIHLVRVIRDTLRTLDIIGRFGGEEFVIVLPDTGIEDACRIVTRLQRELTERIFTHKNERLFVTFSAGVVLRAWGEDSHSVIARADEALYKAKRAGKNRIATYGPD
ncbi:MAG: hypothetical protein JWQ23_879 [Herminiimonas sp.]|nr:hypothetical protein [Herminiimonas sp.]